MRRGEAVGRGGVVMRLRAWWRRTRPDPEFAAALAARWAELPAVSRTKAQVIGRHAVGCEGTHGVFPRCTLSCAPCYHSRDANRVRVDGEHTVREVDAQMALLRARRGPVAHAQLIGGEVTLLDPDDHAASLAAMRRHGREPMSMTHGDMDDDYLPRLVLGPDGRRRFERISFAGHFDSLMTGRRGIPRPPDERSLHPYRRAFVQRFERLRREHGVRFFVAHTMTVSPANLAEVAEVTAAAGRMGFGMLAFQPAAFVGDHRRWHEPYRSHSDDDVWAEISRGLGTRLDHTFIQHGDLRCNRVVYGFWVGERWHPVADGDDARDVAARDAFLDWFGPVNFIGSPPAQLAVTVARVVARHPRAVPIALGWARRRLRAAGVRAVARALLRGDGVRPMSVVMHSFMDAADVAPAWEATRRGEVADDPSVRATQERLAACHYAMAHPSGALAGELVPACVQHAVLDPGENAELRRLLPIVETR